MKLTVIPADHGTFEVEADEGWQVIQLKETIEAMLGSQDWTAASMVLIYGEIVLQNASTLYENGIVELGTIHVFPFDAQYQGTGSYPTNDEEMFSNLGDDFTGGNGENTTVTLSELMAMPSQFVDVKMLLPYNFQADLVLTNSATHHFQTSGQLRDKIENDEPAWLPKLEAYAILSNVNAFVVDSVDDFDNRKNGALGLVRSSDYQDYLIKGRGYNQGAPLAISIEKPAGKFKISGEITLDRREIVGNLWIRRRISVTGDETFNLIQWMAAGSKKKDTVKEELSNAAKALGELKLQLDTVATPALASSGYRCHRCGRSQERSSYRQAGYGPNSDHVKCSRRSHSSATCTVLSDALIP